MTIMGFIFPTRDFLFFSEVPTDFELFAGEQDFSFVEILLEGWKEGIAGGIEVHAGEEDFGAARE